jgi:hypothetical protein
VSRLLPTLAMQDGVLGVMTYTLKSALAPCAGAPLFPRAAADANLQREHEMGCIVSASYAALAGVAPAPPSAAAGEAPAPASFSAVFVFASSLLSALAAFAAVAAALLRGAK